MPVNEASYYSFLPKKCPEFVSNLVERIQEFVSPLFASIQEMFTRLYSWFYKNEEPVSLNPIGVGKPLSNSDSESSVLSASVYSPVITNNIDEIFRSAIRVEGVRDEEVSSTASGGSLKHANSLAISDTEGSLHDEEQLGEEVFCRLSELEAAQKADVNSLLAMKKESVFTRRASKYNVVKEHVYAMKAMDVISHAAKEKTIHEIAQTHNWKSQLTGKLVEELKTEDFNSLELRANVLAGTIESDPQKVEAVSERISKLLTSTNGTGLIDYLSSYKS